MTELYEVGVMIIARKNVLAVRRLDLEQKDLELIFLELIGSTGKLFLGVFYRPPSNNDALLNLQNLLRNLPAKLRCCCLAISVVLGLTRVASHL